MIEMQQTARDTQSAAASIDRAAVDAVVARPQTVPHLCPLHEPLTATTALLLHG